MSEEKDYAGHWSKTVGLTVTVLVIWFVFSFLIHAFVNQLNTVTFLGFPLGFYMAAQGSLVVFVALIFWLTSRQHKIDEEFDVHEE